MYIIDHEKSFKLIAHIKMFYIQVHTGFDGSRLIVAVFICFS